MASIYSDDQRQSLMDSMTNPQSNAAKFLEQGGETGLSPDVTMDILNKYATYGANTGIGNIGGGRFVEGLNEQYRKKVDAPLQQETPKAFLGGLASALAAAGEAGLSAAQATVQKVGEAASSAVEGAGNLVEGATEGSAEIGDIPTDTITAEKPIEFQNTVEAPPSTNLSAKQLNEISPSLELDTTSFEKPNIDSEITNKPIDAPDLENIETQNILEIAMRFPDQLEGYLEANPTAEAAYKNFAPLIGKIIADKVVSDPSTSPTPRVSRYKIKPSRMKTPIIGMNEGGKTPEGSVLGRKMFIEGGEVDGPGGPREDMVPIWASNKEYVMSHNGVKRMGGGDFEQGIAALDKVNKNGVA